jgi:spermidine/putrescine transport system permease protein
MSILATAHHAAAGVPDRLDDRQDRARRARSLMFVMCLIPFWVSETVRTLGWMILLRESGVLPALLVQLGLSRAAPVELLYRDATIWSAWSTPRCCSWWCR